MMNLFRALAAHSDDNCKNEPMVWQVWEDGEITLQKGGDLLWQRNFHMIAPPLPGGIKVDAARMPHQCCSVESGVHGYAYVASEEAARAVRAAIQNEWNPEWEAIKHKRVVELTDEEVEFARKYLVNRRSL